MSIQPMARLLVGIALLVSADLAAAKDDDAHFIQATARVGYSRYYQFDFLTLGGEAALAVFDRLHVVAGAEVYGVSRQLPPDVALELGYLSEWNWITPINLGAIYKFDLGRVEPYAGADAITVQYFRPPEGGTSWAWGARARGGADWWFLPNLGANVNLAVGLWSGRRWSELEPGLRTSGLLPQISVGLVGAL